MKKKNNQVRRRAGVGVAMVTPGHRGAEVPDQRGANVQRVQVRRRPARGELGQQDCDVTTAVVAAGAEEGVARLLGVCEGVLRLQPSRLVNC